MSHVQYFIMIVKLSHLFLFSSNFLIYPEPMEDCKINSGIHVRFFPPNTIYDIFTCKLRIDLPVLT